MDRKIGILAYGSLIEDPGNDLESIIIERIACETPFAVEYGRKSASRGDAPTLIPVESGGSKVNGFILILDKKTTISEAENLLWRRETRQSDLSKKYVKKENPGINTVQVKSIRYFMGVDTVLYTSIGSNLDQITPEILAGLAIKSILGSSGAAGLDGVRYLLQAKKNNIITPLTSSYESLIITHANASTLVEAIAILDAQRKNLASNLK